MPNRTAYSRQYYLENKEALLVKQKSYREKNAEEIRAKDRARRAGDEAHLARCRAYSSREEVKVKAREKNLNKVGWTTELYKYTFEKQSGTCAICKKPNTSERFSVLTADHKHIEPPKPRGLLCGNCNKGLGLFLDNPQLLKAAVLYLEEHDG
jgi:uncharacterized Rmd1/YagE family protein